MVVERRSLPSFLGTEVVMSLAWARRRLDGVAVRMAEMVRRKESQDCCVIPWADRAGG